MATWSPVPDGDYSDGVWLREDTGTNTDLWSRVDEGIGTEDSGIYGTSPGGATPGLTLGASPAGLTNGSVTAVAFRIRHKQSGRGDDTMDWQIRIQTSTATQLAGLSSFGGYEPITTSDPYSTTWLNSSSTSATYVNTGATKAEWDDAILQMNCNRSSVKSADTITWYIDAFEVIVTYTVAGGSLPPARWRTLHHIRL